MNPLHAVLPVLRRIPALLALVAALAVLSCNSPTGGDDGTLQVTIAGLGSVPGAVQVSGPGGYSTTLTASATLSGLTPGAYQVTPAAVGSGAQSWRPAGGPESVTVGSGTASVTVLYRQAAELVVVILGLPEGVGGQVQVSGHVSAVSSPTTHLILDQGTHTVTAATVHQNGGTWNPLTVQQSVVLGGGTTTTVTVTYQAITGQAQVIVTGLPGGAFPAGTVTGPGGFSAAVSVVGTTTLTSLVPGLYTVAFAPVLIEGNSWTPAPATQTMVVTSGQTATTTTRYIAATGSLDLTIANLPLGTLADVDVDGPAASYHDIGASTLLTQLAPGSYTITAATLPGNGNPLLPTPAQQIVTVTAGARATATVTYRPLSTLSIAIDGVQISQATQTYDFSVPLVANRRGLLRVFLRASEANTARPDVRVRFYNGATLTQTFVIPAPDASTPLTVDESALTSSWNLEVTETLMQPGVRMLVDVDPAGEIPLTTRATLIWPASGTPGTLDLRTGPVYQVTFVPVTQTATGATGDVTTGNAAELTQAMRRLHPVGVLDVQVHAPVVFTGDPLNTIDSDPWLALLSQIEQLRVMEGTARYYYGVVHAPSPTWAGFGYIPSDPSLNDSRSAVGWDERIGVLTGASITYAHELGHNLGLDHAPCGSPTSPDPEYPHPDGTTGTTGWDIIDRVLHPPTQFDLMGYCPPVWVGDYSYTRMFRAAPAPAAMTFAALAPRRTLVIAGAFGRGRVVIEPVIEMVTRPTTRAAGPYRLEGRGGNGALLFNVPFAPTPVADAPGNVRHFVLAIPVASGATLSRLRLSGPGIDTVLTAPAGTADAAQAAPRIDAVRLGGGRVRLRWDAVRYPKMVVRQGSDGAVLAIARGGDVTVASAGGSLSLVLSEGLRSRGVTITP